MAELLVGKALHEWLGLLMIVIFVAHHVLNIGWIKNLFKGTYSLSRAFTTCIMDGTESTDQFCVSVFVVPSLIKFNFDDLFFTNTVVQKMMIE
jgi:hypothetical protein